jgi:hypothetical protein
MRFFTLLLLALLTIGCGMRIQEQKINNVVRVFWHEYSRYSVMVKEPNSNELKMIEFARYSCPRDDSGGGIHFYQDVETSKPMYINYKVMHRVGFGSCVVQLDFHIHSENDVEGSGWNHGKFGSGRTAVIR